MSKQAVAQQTEDERRKMPPDEIMKKAWKVVNSCQTPKQAEIAMKYLELLAETHPDLDVGPLRSARNLRSCLTGHRNDHQIQEIESKRSSANVHHKRCSLL